MSKWYRIDDMQAPVTPQNVVLDTKLDDVHGLRNEQQMVLKKNLWWFPDGSMYAYYHPTHWRYPEQSS